MSPWPGGCAGPLALDRRVRLWTPAFAALGSRELKELLEALERFERTALPSDGRKLLELAGRLSDSPVEARRQLGGLVAETYWNANFRLVLTPELLNRMVPPRAPEYAPVNDTVLGVQAQGNSVSALEVAVRFLPDPNRLLMAFLVTGQINAVTTSDVGAARFVTGSHSRYYAQKIWRSKTRGCG